MTTLQNYRDLTYSILKATENDSAYPLALVDECINKARRDICWGSVSFGFTSKDQTLGKVNLTFLEETAYYNTVINTTLSSDATIGGTDLQVWSTSWFSSSGFVNVNLNIIEYSGSSSTSFTGISPTTNAIKWTHKSGDIVRQAYEIPSDLGYISRINMNKYVTLKSVDYRNIVQELSSYVFNNRYAYENGRDNYMISAPFYSIFNWRYIVMFYNQPSDLLPIQMFYQKKANDISAWDDCIIPSEYALTTVPYLAAAEIQYNRWEVDTAIQLKMQWATNTNNMYKKEGMKTNELQFGRRVPTYSDTNNLMI